MKLNHVYNNFNYFSKNKKYIINTSIIFINITVYLGIYIDIIYIYNKLINTCKNRYNQTYRFTMFPEYLEVNGQVVSGALLSLVDDMNEIMC